MLNLAVADLLLLFVAPLKISLEFNLYIFTVGYGMMRNLLCKEPRQILKKVEIMMMNLD